MKEGEVIEMFSEVLKKSSWAFSEYLFLFFYFS